MPIIGLVLVSLAAIVNVLTLRLGSQRSASNILAAVTTVAATLFFGLVVIGEGIGGAWSDGGRCSFSRTHYARTSAREQRQIQSSQDLASRVRAGVHRTALPCHEDAAHATHDDAQRTRSNEHALGDCRVLGDREASRLSGTGAPDRVCRP